MIARSGCSRSTVRYTLGPVGSTLTNGFGTRKRRTPRRVLLIANKHCEIIANGGNVLIKSFRQFSERVSCCSLGKLIRRSNAFCFSLRLRSASLSIPYCWRFRSRCSRRTHSSWRRASALSSRAFLSLSLMIAEINPSRVARGTPSRSAARSIHSRHSPGARLARRCASAIARLTFSAEVISAYGKSKT
jgi:hypothetical protein